MLGTDETEDADEEELEELAMVDAQKKLHF
jgi:hypothetical protein